MKKQIFLLISLLFISSKLFAQWQKVNGPSDGLVYCIAGNNGVILSGTDGGLYFSTNEGLSWSHAPIKWKPVFGLINWGDTLAILYQGYDNSGVTNPDRMYFQLSYDFGQTWQDSTLVSTYSDSDFSGKLSKVGSGFLCVDNAYIAKYSNDNGATFNFLPTNDAINNPSPYIYSYSVDGNKLIYVFDSYINGIMTVFDYVSFDGLQTFFQLDTNKVKVVMLDSTIIATNVSNGFDLKISHDLGQTWDSLPAVPPGIINNTIFRFKKTASSIYMVSSSPSPAAYFVSHDHGISWLPYNTGNVKFDTVSISNNNSLALHDDLTSTILLLNPNDEIIGNRMDGIYSGTYRSIKTSENRMFARGSRSLFTSDDNGINWVEILRKKNINISAISYKNDTLLVGYPGGTIIRSVNLGQSWDTLYAPLTLGTYNLSMWNSKYIYSTWGTGFISHDYGQSWDTLLTQFQNLGYTDAYQIKEFGNGIYAVHSNGVFERLNSSYGWDSLFNIPANSTNIKRFFEVDNKILFHKGINNPYFISSDSGATWSNIPMTGILNVAFEDIIKYNNYWYAIKTGENIYASDNEGQSWSIMPNSFFTPHTDLDTLNGVLYATSISNGLWKYNGDSLTAVSGKAFYDLNNNGTMDVGEPPVPNATVHLVNQNTSIQTNLNGSYSFFSIDSSDAVSCNLNNSIAQAMPQTLTFNGNNDQLNFAFQYDTSDYDIGVFASVPFVVSGYNFNLDVSIANNALPVTGGIIKMLPHTNVSLSANTISDPAISFSGDTIIYQISGMGFQEQQYYSFEFDSIVGFNLGDTVRFEVWAISNEYDLAMSDNYRNVVALVVGSFDPNDKRCLTGTYFTPQQLQNNEEIEYQIRFENTGNYYAQLVRILDTLSAHLDPSTLRILSSSHLTNYTINNQIINFYFPGICLPSVEQDSIFNKGYVAFAIKCKSTTAQFDIVNNAADIYFDFNTPIHTNTVTTYIDYPPVVVTSLSANNNLNQGFKVYPNPLKDYAIISSKGTSKIKSVTLNSLLGAEIWRQDFNTPLYQYQMIMSEFSDGIYFLTVLDQDDEKTIYKVVKH